MRRFHHGTTDSTNERALAAVAAGEARHLDLHLAIEQTAGRGRRGRTWVSAPGAGLYLSLVWRPARLAPPAALTVAAGLATHDAVRALGLTGAVLVWPNDLLLGGAKLAGVLVETRGLDPARPAYVVGVGLNVGQREFPADLVAERAVTSLALAGVVASVGEAELALGEALRTRLEEVEFDAARLARDYARAAGFEHEVEATTSDERLRGRVIDLCLVQGLSLELADGSRRRLALERLRGLVPVEPGAP